MSETRLTALSKATSREQFVASFCEAAQQLRRDPYRVGMLSPEADTLFLTLPLPVPREFWLLERAGRIVGRLGASVSGTDSKRGTLGFFEVGPEDAEAAAHLLAVAEGWLRNQGVETAYGPIHINTWFPYRFRMGGTDDRSYSWEPVNPPSYPRFFEQAGFVQDQFYHSELMTDLSAIVSGFERSYLESLDNGYTYRPVKTEEGLESEIPILYSLSVAGFQENHLFEPIPEPVFRLLYVAQARKRRALGCFFVVHPEVGEVGFSICFVDEAGQFICKSLVVLSEHQGRGLSLGLLHRSFGAALQSGHREAVGALLQTGNRSEAASRRSNLGWQHHYALFRKEIGLGEGKKNVR